MYVNIKVKSIPGRGNNKGTEMETVKFKRIRMSEKRCEMRRNGYKSRYDKE